MCPTDEPADQEACSESGLSCPYEGGTTHCECWDGDWSCDNCPATEPTDDTSCFGQGVANSRCFFGTTQCYCFTGDTDWHCSTCPATQPADASSCPDNFAANCAYGTTECECRNGSWEC